MFRSLSCITPSRRVRKVSRSGHASQVTSLFQISSTKACIVNKKRMGERLSPPFTPVQEAKDSRRLDGKSCRVIVDYGAAGGDLSYCRSKTESGAMGAELSVVVENPTTKLAH